MLNRNIYWLLISLFLISSDLHAQQHNDVATSNNSSTPSTNKITYKTIPVGKYEIFYREGGSKDKPTILFLHGFPSSSRMWQPLLEGLADQYHVIAPDFIGFGHSSQPDVSSFNYTFDNLASYIDSFTTAISLDKYTLVLQDYGGPIGFRIALKNTQKVQSIIIQNAVSHIEGLSPLWETRKAFWADKEKYYEAVKKNFISLEATRQRHIGSSPHPEKIDPDTWTDEYLFLNKPGMADIQLNLFYDYQNNVKSYPLWQQWLKTNQPKLLVAWGKYDPSFTVQGAWKYKDDVKDAKVFIVNGGHFALDEAAPEVLHLMRDFLKEVYH